MNEVPLEASQVPQADDLDRVVAYVRSVGHTEATPEEAGFTGRDAQYYAHAARVLGLMDLEGGLTELGWRLLEATHPASVLVEAFEQTPLAEAWARELEADSVWELKSNSIVDVLPRIANLADSTAHRRASTVWRWHSALLPVASARPTPTQLRDALLARPLDDLTLPTRLQNFAARSGLATVRDLVALGRPALMSAPNLGRTSVAALDHALRTRGSREGLDALHAHVVGGIAPADAEVPQTEELADCVPWDSLGRHLPESLRETPISTLELPTRLANYCARQGIGTLGALLGLRSSFLLSEPNMGRGSVRDGASVVAEFLKRARLYGHSAPVGDASVAEPWLAPFSLDDHATYESVFRDATRQLEKRTRLVIAGRSGLTGSSSTLLEIGELLGVSRERIRQLETAGIAAMLRDPRWAQAIGDRLDTLLAGQARSLDEIAEDPFFAPATESPEATERFEYLLERLIPGEHVISAWNDGRVVGWTPAREPESAFAAFLESLSGRLPLSRAVIEAEAEAAGEQVAKGFGVLFVERLSDELVFDEASETALARSNTKIERVRAYVLAHEEPVSIHDIYAHFGRVNLPRDFVNVDRGLVTLPANIEGFKLWQDRLVPQCLRIMEERGPELQWMATDLLEALRESVQLPSFIRPWVLAGMLRQSQACADLGRMRFAVGEAGDEGRVHFGAALEKILRDAGGPLSRNELRERLAKVTTFHEFTFNLAVVRLPLLPVDDERIGLIDRDVPGGRSALEAAGELLEHELERREKGFTFGEALAFLQASSPSFGAFTREMVAAIARVYPALVSNRVGLGLDRWESARVESRGEIVRRMVDEGDGEAKVEAVFAALQSREPTALPRSILHSLAYQLGLRIENGTIMERSLAKSAPPPPPGFLAKPAPIVVPKALPSLDELQIPRVARELFAQLLVENEGDWDALLAACAAHVDELLSRHRLNEFLPADDARALIDRARTLVASARASSDGALRRLVWAAVRYFQINDDGETDYSIGGLDDDVAVMNAVLAHLGRTDLHIELS